MKQIIAVLLVIVTIIGLIVVAFTVNQVGQEEARLKSDLLYRSTLLAESLKETIEPNFVNKSEIYLQGVIERFTDKERFAGLGIYDNKNKVIAFSSTAPEATSSATQIIVNAMDSDKVTGDFETQRGKKVYVLAVPLHDDKSVVGALMVIQNAGYIDDRLTEIWKNNLIRLLIQASLLSFAVVLLLRWIIYEPIRGLVETLKLARMGGPEQNSNMQTSSFFFRPLVKEISNIRNSLMEARISASEEARMRLEKLDSPWTAERLKEFVKDILKGRTIFMVSNREPYIHTKNGGNINYYVPASGMVTAIEPVMQACGGMWIAHGSGNADKLVVNQSSKIKVPPEEPKYTLRRIWLTEEEEKGYYDGFSNEGLWPLCHIAHNRPTFRKEDWEEYKKVNQKFADTILIEIKNQDRPIVLIQDFHLALVPRMVKMQRPGAVIGIFWHIPFPNPESFSICPWKKEILDGMLGADLLGFQTQLHCNNFIETVGRELEALINFEQFTVTRSNHISFVKPFPISISFPNGSEKQNHQNEKEELTKKLGIKTKYIGLGIDRLDYTKGILERLKAIEIFLYKFPSYQRVFTFIQIAAPSRTKVKKYRDFAIEVRKETERINNIFKAKDWKPIVLLEQYQDHTQIQEFYRSADFCLITPLHDGMNLVAKEYVAARNDEKGVLILSQYAGASRELKEALIVNPYNGEQTAEAIKTALELSPSEQTKRMRGMREVIKNYNIYRWSAELLKTITNL
ncbi:MAG: trehalose-6-phosphate synthase [Candidatus Daviesbacteria bacterium]|nr:trehalose-6-phosphate synthase [Candidatus Daviesbacteria bacterium]